jgi:aspartyl-tRNA(Asn)/glutamyl-tRNA(Gln) amidotransferase subunit A
VEEARRTIERRNGDLRAVLTVLGEPERGAADAPLSGVPYVLKDTWDTAGIRTTGGSWRHRARVPAESSRPHAALRKAGAVLLGKSSLCDLAFSTESDNHLLGPVRNPHDPSRTAGGSTGGGAAAVASGMAAFDWGTDFGGSIRLPSAYCGVVGLRLSAETWPVEREHFPRINPRFWDFCGQGPLAQGVASERRVVEAVAGDLRIGRDVRPAIDPGSVILYGPDRAHHGAWPGFVKEVERLLFGAGVRMERAVPERGNHGVFVPSPSHARYVFDGYLASNFFQFVQGEEMSIREGVPAVLLALASRGMLDRRVHPNTAILFLALLAGRATVYRDAAKMQDALEALRTDVRSAWGSGRLVVAPTSTTPAPKHGRAAYDLVGPTFCKLGNLVDATAISIPFGRFDDGLPRGLQILGPPGSEDAVLDLAARLERSIATFR